MGHVCNENSIFQVKQNSEKQKLRLKEICNANPGAGHFEGGVFEKWKKERCWTRWRGNPGLVSE